MSGFTELKCVLDVVTLALRLNGAADVRRPNVQIHHTLRLLTSAATTTFETL
jgi:hypothetical protein